MIKHILFCTFLLFSLNVLFSQNQAILKEVDAYLNNYMDSVPMPGIAVVIVQDDQVIFQKGYGVEKEGGSKKMTPQTVTGVGELTMSMTAMAVLQLAEKGQLNLDDKVTKYLPWFKTANKSFSDQITIRMLLNHTSGIPPQFEAIPSLNDETAVEEFVRSMDSYYINKTPGFSYGASREGYCVAGLIISKVSGKSYADYMEQNIFVPLAMNQTTTNPTKLTQLNALYGHEIGLEECVPAQKSIFQSSYVPAGSEMRSTSADLGNYLIALVNEGRFKGKQVLSAESVEEMFKTQITFNGLGTMLGGNGLSIDYGLGWLKMLIDERLLYVHTGNTGTMSSITGINPATKTAMAVLFNADSDRFDQFVFPSIQNVGNNILHLLANEPTTDFARVRFDDPFDDYYDLQKADWSKYTGRYVSIGDAHPIYKDYTIDVFVGKSDSLELKGYKEEVLKGHFKLQFSSPSRAVLRSIVQPREIQFKLNPNGAITGVFIFGSEFKKKDATLEESYTSVQAPNNTLSFLFPKNWTYNWAGNQFKAQSPNNAAVQLKGDMAAIVPVDFDTYCQQQLTNQTIISKGILKKETVKDGIWTEQSFCTKEGELIKQQLLVRYQDPKTQQQLNLILSNPWGEFSADLQEVMMRLQKSVGFNELKMTN